MYQNHIGNKKVKVFLSIDCDTPSLPKIFKQLLGKNSSKQVAVEHSKQTSYPFVVFNKN